MSQQCYFAYGSNLHQQQMEERCPDSEPLAPVKLKDHRLLYRRGVATIERFRGDVVYGAVYVISERDLANLDMYEGYPKLYKRKNYELERLDESETIEAIGYYMPAHKYQQSLPSCEYYQTIKTGFQHWDLPVEHLEQNLEEFKEKIRNDPPEESL